MSTPLLTRTETIAGYTIRERIGGGGYGEVWRAEAPGGLEKAIKFVYGQLDESRAVCEWKALNRVKEARHPFLLSLERVEVIDGQLIIVTELAERSLKDRYDECRQARASGIPRDELLRYLGDAADALDYLRQRYSLQHLDIKPENLLILGGRVKVADFGLVKDLKHTKVSLVEGLTPVYAPPEAFDDQVSSSSDQYSLAIVYQEMLTGILPFPGRTASQLAMQHRYSRPQLGALPEPERATIAKALSKDSADRFPSCRAMVDSLLGRRNRDGDLLDKSEETDSRLDSFSDTTPGSVLATEVLREAEPRRGSSHAAVLASKPAAPQAISPESGMLTVGHSAQSTRMLPPVAIPEAGPQLHPTLFLGIGGMAAKTLRRLRMRLQNRFGDAHAVPSLAMLLVDTDRREIARAIQGDEATTLKHNETLLMPLRRPEQYRAQSGQLLRWLSRRWLYNIPSSLQTEGLRPLGRLALVDHAQTLSERVSTVLQSILSQESTAASAGATGWQVAAAEPRVFVVASVSGGTGGGMAIDVAYLVRQKLRELCLPEESVCGILMHRVGRRSNDTELGVANTCACLLELEQYCRQGYPGDEACRIPAFGRGPTFHDTYLIHDGNRQDQSHCEATADAVAEYLYLNAATSSGRFFDAGRRREHEAAESRSAGVRYRTFGISRVGCLHSEVVNQTADAVAAAVLQRWRGEPADLADRCAPPDPSVVAAKNSFEQTVHRLCEECLAAFPLGEEAITAEVRRLVEEVLQSPPEKFVHDMLPPILAGSAQRPAQEILAEITAATGPPLGEVQPEDFTPAAWQWRLSAGVKELARKQAKTLQNRLYRPPQEADLPIAAIRRAAQQLDGHLRLVEEAFRERSAELEYRLSRTVATAYSGKGQKHNWFGLGKKQQRLVGNAWYAVAVFRLEQTQLWVAEQITRVLRSDLATIRDQLAGLLQELNLCGKSFTSKPSAEGPPSAEKTPNLQASLERQTRKGIREHLPELISRSAASFIRQHVHPREGVQGLLENRPNLGQWLPAALRIATRQAAIEGIRETDALAELLAACAGEVEPLLEILRRSVPGLSVCGSSKRLLALLPPGADGEFQGVIGRAIHEAQSVRLDFDNELVLCQEHEQIPFAHAVAAVCQENQGYLEIAARVHTRIDVSWKRMRLEQTSLLG